MGSQLLFLLLVSNISAIISGMTLLTDENTDELNNVSPIDNEKLHEYTDRHRLRHVKPADCAEISENGYTESGMYEIYLTHRSLTCEKVKVYCDMKTDRGGWTVIQRRGDYKRADDYFYKNWTDYKEGFGSKSADFWLGNDIIHVLTNQKKYSVRFDLVAFNGTEMFALYEDFFIENEALKYRLHINNYSGTAGDSMVYHKDMFFSTRDRDNDQSSRHCAQVFNGAWWYRDCVRANLNGLWPRESKSSFSNVMIWVLESQKSGPYATFVNAEIKIRPKDF